MFRWLALVALAGTISISAYHRRRARQESGIIPRRREEVGLKIGRFAIALPLFAGAVLYLLHPPWMDWSSFPVPHWIRWTGVVMGLVTLPAAHWVLRNLGRNVSETVFTKERHELVRSGPYRWIRHPLYTTGIALFVAIGLTAANWFVLVFAVLALASIRLVVIPREEKELRAAFGEEYERYARTTGSMLPRIHGRGHAT